MHRKRQDIDYSALKAALLARKASLLGEDAATRAERAPPAIDPTASGHMSRLGALEGQAVAVALGRQRHREEERIAAALERMADGEYGFCVACDAKIPAKRLELDPAVPTCIKCAEKAEHS